jgi:hypothetical protein
MLLCATQVAVAQQGNGYAFRTQGTPPSGAFVPMGNGPADGGYGAYPYYPAPAAPAYFPYGFPQNVSLPGSVPAVLPPAAGADLPSAGAGMPGYDIDDDDKPAKSLFHRETKEHLWAEVDYVMAWFHSESFKGVLATTGSTADLHPGAIGQPGTVPLFGQDGINYGMFSGIHAEVGLFLDEDNHFSVEVGGMYVFPNHRQFTALSDPSGNPLIARPVFSTQTQQEVAFLDAFPGTASGGIAIETRSELFGAELNARVHGYGLKRLHADALLGFRFQRLEETLEIQDQLTPLVAGTFPFSGTLVNPPGSLADVDHFHTSNTYYGVQIGGRLSWEEEWFCVSVFGKASLGPNDERVTISGSSTMLTPGAGQTVPGGILALPSNIGEYRRTVLGFVPEAGITLGVNVSSHVRFNVGYSFLYWNQVVRPGGQLDRQISPAQVPTDITFAPVTTPGSRPQFTFNDESFWAHTLTFGIEFHY